MSSFPNSSETELPKLARLAVRFPIYHQFRVSGSVECVCATPVGRLRYVFAALPVADVVSVAVYESDLDIIAEKLLQVFQVPDGEVARQGKRSVDQVRGRVVKVRAKSVLRLGLV